MDTYAVDPGRRYANRRRSGRWRDRPLRGLSVVRASGASVKHELVELPDHVVSRHLSNILIEFTGADEARSEATLFAWHRFPGDAPDAFLYARYLDRVVRTPDGWRIAERVLRMAGRTGFDAHRRYR